MKKQKDMDKKVYTFYFKELKENCMVTWIYQYHKTIFKDLK